MGARAMWIWYNWLPPAAIRPVLPLLSSICQPGQDSPLQAAPVERQIRPVL